jgi:maltose O-acetyltransferase
MKNYSNMKIVRKILEYLRGEPQHLGKLIKRGLRVGKNFYRGPGVIIDPMHCYHITIGDNVSLAPRVHILAHDASTAMFLGKTRAANVTIGNEVFVGAGSIILPGVHIGNRVIIGAGSIVSKDIPDNSVALGNPAKVVCPIDEYLEKEKAKMRPENTFKGLWWERPNDISKAIAAADKYGEIFVSSK